MPSGAAVAAAALSPSTDTDRSPGKLFLPVLVGVLLLPAALGSSQTIFNDGDVSWHIASGRWILTHHAIPTTDPFSFTWAGKPWVPMEWLADLIHASAYLGAGYSGVAALVIAALVALNAIVFVNAARCGRHALLALAAMDLVLMPTTLARPHVLIWPILAGWTWLLMRARERDRAPPILSALILSVWANLHASWVMALLLAGGFGMEALVASDNRPRALRDWLTFGLACLAAVCVNANGLRGVLYPLGYTDLKMLPLIDEWKPSSLQMTPFFFAVLAVALGLIAWKRPRLHPVRWVLLGALLLLSMLQLRHQAVLAIVAAMVLPEGFAKGTPQPSAQQDLRNALAVTAAGAFLLLTCRLLVPLTPSENATNPWKLIASVPPELRSRPVLNSYSMGGPLILAGIRPYIDGRGDMYGDSHVLAFSRITGGDARELSAAVQRWNIRWAIFALRDQAAIALLDRTPGWRRIREDSVGVIYVRDEPRA